MKLKMNCDVSVNCQSAFGSSPSVSTSPDSRSCMTANVSISADCCNECSCSGEDKGTQDTSLVQTEQNKPSLSSIVKRKKKRKRVTTICTTHCRYEVVRRIANSFGMREVGEKDNWNLFWTDCFISVERAKEMKRYQKVNHFPGMSEICRKDLLARNLNRMLKFFPKDYNFFPKTWCLPADLGEALAYSRANRNKTFILKPDLGCRGKGIFITKNLKELKPYDHMICQVYICKPLLLDGFKFDMRIYALITSCDPLRIFVYNDGLARFATSRYCQPDICNANNLYMHLTNYSVNKHSRTFVIDEQFGSKRYGTEERNHVVVTAVGYEVASTIQHGTTTCAFMVMRCWESLLDSPVAPWSRISTVNNWLQRRQYNVSSVWAGVDDIIIKTVISAYPTLKHSYHACFPGHDITVACFELLGFDILLDYKLKPYLLEVNHSPSFHTDAELDKDVKESLLRDTFVILNLNRFDKRKVIEEDKQRVRDRLTQNIQPKALIMQTETNISQEAMNTQVKWEENHLGNFRLIYPTTNPEAYEPFFNQTQSTLFQDTFASRAREEALRLQREELEVKHRGEAVLRMSEKLKTGRQIVSSSFKTSKLDPIKPFSNTRKSDNSNSFEPTPIVESEENERIAGMAQRDKLVRSCRIIDQVCTVVKKTGNIKGKDFNLLKIENKHTKEDEANKSTKDNVPIKEPSIPMPSAVCHPKAPPALTSCARRSQGKITDALRNAQLVKGTVIEPSLEMNTYGKFDEGHDRWHISKGVINRSQYSSVSSKNTVEKCNSILDLEIMCNEASITTRPDVPAMAKWPMILGSKPNKTHIVRHLSNTVKLHGIEQRSTFH